MLIQKEDFDRLSFASQSTIRAKVICDSVNPLGVRLTTMEWTYPRCIHSEIMTHRMFSKNSASSRAIPMAKMIERVETNPFFPIHWGKNEKGMQANEELAESQKLLAAQRWLEARDAAVDKAKALAEIGIHKQIGNRLLEPWMWITIIISGTQWENLFALRCHKAAEPHFQDLAFKARDAYDKSKPQPLRLDEWHLPLFGFPGDEEIPNYQRPMVSAGRCARVSYLTHDGVRDPQKDIDLYNQLSGSVPLHASPLEHPAKVSAESGKNGNFGSGWIQFRKLHANECIDVRNPS